MSRFRTSPRAPLDRQWPAVALLALLLILSIEHVYLQLAFPLHAVGLAAGLALLGIGMALIPASSPGTRSPAPKLYIWIAALQAAWAVWNGIALLRAPVAAIGRTEFSTVLQGFLVFWVVAEAARRWGSVPPPSPGTPPPAPPKSDRSGRSDRSDRSSQPTGAEPAAEVDSHHLHGMTPPQIVGLWWAVVGVALSVYAIYQVLGPAGWPKTFATLHDSILSGLGSEAETEPILASVLHALKEGRAFATFGAPNIFGGFLIVAALLLAGFAFSARGTVRRVLSGLGAGIVVWALLLSQSRGAMLAFALALPFFACRLWWDRRGEGPRSPRRLPPAASMLSKIGVVAGLALLTLAPRWIAPAAVAQPPGETAALLPESQPTQSTPSTSSTQSTSSTVSTLRHSPGAPSPQTESPQSHPFADPTHRTFLEHILSGSTVRQRLYYWRTALSLWAPNPFTGGGSGSYEVRYPQLRRSGSGETIYAHSWFFQFGSETGMVGVALFLAVVLTSLIAVEKAMHRPRSEGASPCVARSVTLLIAFEAAAVAMLVHGLVDYTLSQREMYLDLQLILGIAAGTFACGAAGSEATAMTAAPFRPPLSSPAVWTLKIAIIVIFVFLYIQCAVQPLYARFYTLAARDVAADPAGQEEAIRLYRRALDWEPDSPGIMASLGMAELQAGRARGLDLVVRAARINPYSAATQAMLARARDWTGSPALAVEALRKAVELHPLDLDHRLDLAERLLREGQRAEAARQLDEAAALPLPASRQTERMEALRRALAAYDNRQ